MSVYMDQMVRVAKAFHALNEEHCQGCIRSIKCKDCRICMEYLMKSEAFKWAWKDYKNNHNVGDMTEEQFYHIWIKRFM